MFSKLAGIKLKDVMVKNLIMVTQVNTCSCSCSCSCTLFLQDMTSFTSESSWSEGEASAITLFRWSREIVKSVIKLINFKMQVRLF